MYPFSLPLLAPAYISIQYKGRILNFVKGYCIAKGPHFEAWTRPKPESGSSPTFIFEARFSPESQIYRGSLNMLNCGVTKNVVFGHSCRYTVYHTQKNNHLDQTINIIWHKRSILVNDNAAEYNVSQEKKETIMKLSTVALIGMKSRLVGFLKQAKNCVSDWSFWGKAIACQFPHRCRLLKKSARLIPAENKERSCVCKQN